jgi:proteic killer suppression protein
MAGPDGGLSRYTGIVYCGFVIRSFADETTRDLFGSVNSKAARRIPNTAWRVAQRKLKQLDLVATLDSLKIPPGNDLHALKGDQAGRHTIRVNDQYRITFRWEGHDAFDVRCEDYH